MPAMPWPAPSRTSLVAYVSRVLALDSAAVHELEASPPPGQRGISEALRRFTEDLPYERGPILDFVIDVAAATPAGARVLDVGAGDAPYRELFVHAGYVTNDWAQSQHPGARSADVIASAAALPLEDGAFDLVLCTQVLEHVPEPSDVLAECFRVLAPGGRIALTVPLLWEQHEMPHDFYRYTESGLRHLLTKAGFSNLQISPRSDGFTAIAQLLINLGWAMGDADDGLTTARIEARDLLADAAERIAQLAPLDAARSMPLGFTATGHKL
jgi:SAM-dependent methyltransferase